MRVLKNILTFIGLFLIYLIVPQIVGSIFYTIGLSENLSILLADIVVILIFFFMCKTTLINSFKEYISDINNFADSMKYWGIGFLIMCVSNLLLSYLVFNGGIAANEELNRASLTSSPIIGFFLVVLVAPIIEEMVFRYGLRIATNKTKYFPLISALIFGILHALTAISSPLELLYTIPYGALGYMFALLYNKSDNIFSSITSHMIHNALCYIVILFAL